MSNIFYSDLCVCFFMYKNRFDSSTCFVGLRRRFTNSFTQGLARGLGPIAAVRKVISHLVFSTYKAGG